MNIDDWTVQDWILRGLVMTCITEHDLYEWYRKRATKPVDRADFNAAVADLQGNGLVYVQRQVPCHQCKGPDRYSGLALTEAGQKLDPLTRETA